MADSYFLLAAIFIPLLLAPLAYVIGRRAGAKTVTWFSFGALAVSTGLLLIPAVGIYTGQQKIYFEQYEWGQFGHFGLRLDGLSMPFAIIIYILCTILALYSRPYMVHKVSEDLPGHGNQGGESGGIG
ncbi:MAG: formate hydrogenlyase, partial [Thermoproteota archaeon]|nr:formate hydrogenlyase [Thermoproteota archaeon]